jgi:uncharacterized protein (TIGR03083 family)
MTDAAQGQDMKAFGRAYQGARERLSDLVLAASPEELERQVPACPEWTVKELVSHVTGIAADMLAGNVAEAGRSDWTQRQIDERRDHSIEEIVAEWKDVGSQVEAAMEHLHPAVSGLTVGDLVVHEHDARNALGNKEARDTDGVQVAFNSYSRWLGRRIRKAELPTLELVGSTQSVTAGKEEPVGRVTASDFELLRAITGRRTWDEVRSLEWSADPELFGEVLSPYPRVAESLNE